MPRKTERHAAVLNKLKSVVQHTDSKVAAERRLAIERWVKTYIKQVEYLKDGKLQFLYNIFRNESCWSGTRLNNTILGQRFTEEKTGGIENPLSRYDMACRYCVIDKIPLLFQRQFESYKSSFSSEEVDDDGKPATSNNKYVKSKLLSYMKSQDPVFSFWIDKESGGLKEHGNAADGFKKAIKFKWSEGVEYFYHCLNEQVKEEEITSAITTLSSVQCDHNGAVILDFCLSKMSDQAKNKLFKDSELSKKDKGVYSLLSALIHQGFFDTVQAIVPMFKDKVLADKILSTQDYTLLLSSLSDTILENPELGIQAKAVMMDLWRCEHFNEHKKAAVDFSNSANLITDVLANLVIDWKNDNDKNRAIAKKGEILEMLQFAKNVCSPGDFRDFKEDVIDDLKTVGRDGMKRNVDYDKLAKKLFAELDNTLPSGRGDVSGTGDPQSTLGSAEVSSFSGHSSCANSSWQFGIFIQRSIDELCVFLYTNNGCQDCVTVSLSIKRSDGQLFETKISPKGKHVSCGYVYPVIFALSELEERKAELLPSDTLTIVWNLKFALNEKTPAQQENNLNEKSALENLEHRRLVETDVLSKNLKDLFANKSCCDAVLKVKDKEFKVHKAILIGRSSVFAAMFQHDTSEKQTGIVNIPDCDEDSFQEFLEYLYSGKLEDITTHCAVHLYRTSDKYDAKELKTFCTDYIMKNLTIQTLCEAVFLADEYDDAKIFSAAQDFFNQNHKKVFKTDEWENLLKTNYRLANKLLNQM